MSKSHARKPSTQDSPAPANVAEAQRRLDERRERIKAERDAAAQLAARAESVRGSTELKAAVEVVGILEQIDAQLARLAEEQAELETHHESLLHGRHELDAARAAVDVQRAELEALAQNRAASTGNGPDGPEPGGEQHDQLRAELANARRHAADADARAQELAAANESMRQQIEAQSRSEPADPAAAGADAAPGQRGEPDARVEALERKCAELAAQREQMAKQAETLQKHLSEARAQLHERSERGDVSADGLGAADDGASVPGIDPAELDSLRRQNFELQQQLEFARQQIEAAGEAAAPAEGSQIDAAPLHARIAELEAELAQARANPTPGPGGNEGPASVSVGATAAAPHHEDEVLLAVPEEIQRMKLHLREIAQHLQARQRRLHGLRKALRKKPRPAAAPVAAPAARGPSAAESADEAKRRKQMTEAIMAERQQLAEEKRHLANERHRLADLQTTLAVTESQMRRKWAPRSAIVVTASFAVLLTFLAAASWFTVDRFFPARVSASVTLTPQTRDFKPLSDDARANWRTWHTELIADSSFRETLLKRMRDRQMPVETMDLAAIFGQRLTVDEGEADELRITMSGTNRHEVADVLDVLTSTLIAESARQVTKRSDNAWAAATKETAEGGVTRYASFNPNPIQDSRLLMVGPFMVAYVLLALSLYVAVLNAAKRMKRIVGDEQITVEADALAEADIMSHQASANAFNRAA